MAEAKGNRTPRTRYRMPLGFEDREAHQALSRLRNRLYCNRCQTRPDQPEPTANYR